MSRPVWKGQISFGLVQIPITLYSGEIARKSVFRLIDKRNSARVHYERVNEQTGEEVPWNAVVKGYETSDGQMVLFTDEELAQAAVKMTKTIEIEQFVDADEIEPIYFYKPYYLVPNKGGEKGYALLREAMAETKRAGIARVVIHTRQYLAALLVEDEALVLNLLRFPQELREIPQDELPGRDLRQQKISTKEIQLARQLIEGMYDEWKPELYHDEFQAQLQKMIDQKVKAGDTEQAPADEDEPPRASINFLEALSQSVKQSSKSKAATASKRRPRRKTAGKKKHAS